jgi:L-ascorbate metabolism protein UlaG (beta-lactamase superfamily)
MEISLTHVGGPTALIEVGGWRLLTDPTFDPPGRSYRFGWGTGSRKLTGPAVVASELGPITGADPVAADRRCDRARRMKSRITPG